MKVIYEKNSYSTFCGFSPTLSPIPHVQKEIELIYVLSGRVNAIADYNHFELNAGDMFLAFPNQIHYYETLELGNFCVIIFSPDLIAGANSIFHNYVPEKNVITPKPGGTIHTAIHNISKKAETRSTTYKAGWLNLLMDSFLLQVTLAPNTSTNNSTLRNVLNYCSENFNKTLTLDNVAEALHINKYYISKLVNKRLGLTFNEYINSLRINHACSLLEHATPKIADISEEVGFGSIRSFNRAFYEVMNMTPTEYRTAYRKQNNS